MDILFFDRKEAYHVGLDCKSSAFSVAFSTSKQQRSASTDDLTIHFHIYVISMFFGIVSSPVVQLLTTRS